ncbi:MAG: hypothetical protein GWO24_28130, partial [Akkermansiaceae bacterium]|nr:hypothetical protein [Akkermansiaceae bacterium]
MKSARQWLCEDAGYSRARASGRAIRSRCRWLPTLVAAAICTGCGPGKPESQEQSSQDREAAAERAHSQMVKILARIAAADRVSNPYYSEMPVRRVQQALQRARQASASPDTQAGLLAELGKAQLDYGEIEEALKSLHAAHDLFSQGKNPERVLGELSFALGIAYLRWAETENCCARNTPSSCIVPFQREAIHTWKEGSQTAIRYFQQAIATDGVPVA